MTHIWFLKEFGLYFSFIDTSFWQPLGPEPCILSLVKQDEGKQLQNQKKVDINVIYRFFEKFNMLLPSMK